MPCGDGTGPRGRGQGSGRRRMWMASDENWVPFWQMTKQEQKEFLEERLKRIEEEKLRIEEKIKELE